MDFDDYKVVLYRNHPDGWVAEIPAIHGCHALMPTREEALAELVEVFRLISEEHQDRNQPLPADTTETAAQVRERVAEMIELADDDLLDVMRSRGREQEVLDMLDEPAAR